ncbi:MAG: hypothetical protein AAF480_10630 [Actinomycetota bacterium]
MTQYTTADPETVQASLPAAVDQALDAAAARIGAERHTTVSHADDRSLRLEAGLRELDGSSVSVVGHPKLVEIQVRVPWDDAAGRERRSLAAAAFAGELGKRVLAA